VLRLVRVTPCLCCTSIIHWCHAQKLTVSYMTAACVAKCIIITGSMCEGQTPVFWLLRGRFWGFCPAKATRCTDRWNLTSLHGLCGVPKSENFTQCQNTNARHGRIPSAIFAKCLAFVGGFMLRRVLKYGRIRSRLTALWSLQLGVHFLPNFQRPSAH